MKPRQWYIVWLFVGIVMLQLALGALSVDMMSAVRAYVSGKLFTIRLMPAFIVGALKLRSSPTG